MAKDRKTVEIEPKRLLLILIQQYVINCVKSVLSELCIKNSRLMPQV